MKKQTVVIIWAAVLLLLVISCFGIYLFYDAVNDTKIKNGGVEVFRCIPSEIEEFSVSGKNGGYTLEKKGEVWQVDDAEALSLNYDAIEKVINSASNIVAVGTISRDEAATFDSATSKLVEIETRNNDSCEIRFLGTKGGLAAFRVEGDRHIYTMYSSGYEILTPDLDKLRVTEVFEGLAKSEELPEYYKYTDYDNNIVMVRTKTAAELAVSKKNRYVMESPYKKEVDDEAFEQQITVKIPAIKATSFVKPGGADLASFGLDKESRAELKFKWNGKEQVLYLGKNEGGFVYAVKGDLTEVFKVNSSLVEFLHVDPFYIINNGILKMDEDNIRSVSVKTAEFTCDISRSGEYYSVNGKTSNKALFEEITDKLSDIELSGELTNIPENSREIVITARYDNGSQQTFSFARVNDKEYAVFIDGKAEFAVKTQTVSEFLDVAKAAVNNPIKIDEKG